MKRSLVFVILLTACGQVPGQAPGVSDPISVAAVTPAPTPTVSPSPQASPSPAPSASPLPVLTYSLSRSQFPFGQLCVDLFAWYGNQGSADVHLVAADLSYYYTLSSSGVTVTQAGQTDPVGQVVLIFTNQNGVGLAGTCTLSVQSGQIVSLQ